MAGQTRLAARVQSASRNGGDMRLGRTGPRACGRLGPDGDDRLQEMAKDLDPVLATPLAALAADGAVAWADGNGASWSPRPLPTTLSGPAEGPARDHDAISVVDHGDHAQLHGGISGAVPLYVQEGQKGAHFSSSLEPLLRSQTSIRPDWDGWAQMLASGGPLGGRTTIEGIRRLRPWERVRVDRAGKVSAQTSDWPWLEQTPGDGPSLDAVGDALAAAVAEIAEQTPLAPLLSGGWDSRILATLATRSISPAQVIARTTSSDTGTVMEELIAAKVAEHLGVQHRLLQPRRDEFGADVDRFAQAVDHQTAFHFWFVPAQRDLSRADGTALDGLGGGLFLGGAFPDPTDSSVPVLERRFAKLVHYLQAAPSVLAPQVIETIRDRTRAGFEAVAQPLLDHPFAATFTAYLNRTLPGISLAPYGLLAASTTVATPFLDHRVVTEALRIAPPEHAGGRLYRKVLAPFDPWLAELPTAEDLAPWPRPHPRRIASVEAARYIRDLVLAEPVRPLLREDLASADLNHWSRLLSTTGSQHLLRGLAVMSLWFSTHGAALNGQDARGLIA